MKWTADIHEHLLISVFQVTKFSGDQVKAILADMQARGYPITDRALTQHIQKLKKSRDATNSNPSTPKKPIKAAGGSRTTSGKKRALKTVKYDDEEDEVLPKDEASDDEDDVSVSPKIKRAKTEVYTHFNEAAFAPL